MPSCCIFFTSQFTGIPAAFILLTLGYSIPSLSKEISRRTKELTNRRQTLAANFNDETGNQ